MKTVIWLIWTPIIMVESKNTSGLQFRLQSMERLQKKDGTVQDIIIGEKEDEPVLVISDLLIHLSQQQIEKKRRAW